MTDWIPPRTRQRLADERSAQAAAQSTDLPIFAPHNGTETSRAAAEKISKQEASDRRDRIVAALANAPHGLTRAELVLATGMKENSVNSACHSCVEKGLVAEHPEWVRDGRRIVFHLDYAPRRAAA